MKNDNAFIFVKTMIKEKPPIKLSARLTWMNVIILFNDILVDASEEENYLEICESYIAELLSEQVN